MYIFIGTVAMLGLVVGAVGLFNSLTFHLHRKRMKAMHKKGEAWNK